MPDLTQNYQPTAGTDGRVRKHGSPPTILAGVTKWERFAVTKAIPVKHFGAPADPATLTVQPRILKSLGGNKVRVEGNVNLDPADQTETGTTNLTNGVFVTLDLYGSKSEQVGYSNVAGLVTEFKLGQSPDNRIFPFSAEITIDGPFPAWGDVA